VRWCPWPLSPQVIAHCSTGYELLQLPKQRRSFGAPGLISRLAALPGERQAAARRAGHRSPAQFLIHHTASLTISGVRSKLVRPGANACTTSAMRLRRSNRRLAAVSGLFGYQAMRDPAAPSPIPRRAEARRAAAGKRSGLLAHLARPKRRSGLRVRELRRLPRPGPAEPAALLASFRTD
jgi:hypothetical protein